MSTPAQPPNLFNHKPAPPDDDQGVDLANWAPLMVALAARPQQAVPPRVRQQLMARILASQRKSAERHEWLWRSVSYAALMQAIFLLLWFVVQPGVVLEWSSGAREISAFRVYRAAAGSSAFQLVAEIPAQAELAAYNFVDAWLLPGQQFTYLVEGLTPNGQTALSQAVSESALTALPGQLALFITSIVLAGLVLVAGRLLAGFKWQTSQNPLA